MFGIVADPGISGFMFVELSDVVDEGDGGWDSYGDCFEEE